MEVNLLAALLIMLVVFIRFAIAAEITEER